MGRLICTGITSLDGCIADERGDFVWGEPDEQMHAFVNERERRIGTYLYGRALYEVMSFWETMGDDPAVPAVEREYATVWRAADKIVYSTTLPGVHTARTRLERSFDPAAVRVLKEAAERDLSIGGPGLAAHALRAGLVDEVRLYVCPVVVGGGKRFLPDGVRLDLRLVEQHRFASGVVFRRYDRARS